jgi:hypothetical protein
LPSSSEPKPSVLLGITSMAMTMSAAPNTCHHTLMSPSRFSRGTPNVFSRPWRTRMPAKMMYRADASASEYPKIESM